jgi:fibronectin-binding autotransporter adhesin
MATPLEALPSSLRLTAALRAVAATLVWGMVLTLPAFAQTIDLGFDEAVANATVQPAGARSGNNGRNFLNIQSNANGNNSSYGAVEWNLGAGSFENAPAGLVGDDIAGLGIRLTQSLAGFSATTGLRFWLWDNNTPSLAPGSQEVTFDLAAVGGISTPPQPWFADPYRLWEIGTGSFAPTTNGDQNTFLFTTTGWNPAARDYVATQLNSGGLLRVVIEATTPNTGAATYAGFSNSNFAGPELQLTVAGVAPQEIPSYWTANGTALGGSGTWSAGGSNWSPTVTPVVPAAWDGTKVATFSGSAGAVTVSGTLPASGGLAFLTNGYTLASGGLTLADAPGFAHTSFTVAEAATATVATPLGGSVTAVRKMGPGTLALSGSNTFSGAVRLVEGTLRIASGAALGNAANGLEFDGGRLATTASFDLGGRSVGGVGTTPGTAVIDIAAGTTLAASGAWDLANLTLPNTGTLSLLGFSSGLGNITATAPGSTRIEGDITFGAAGRRITVGEGALLELPGASAGDGTIQKVGPGVLVLSGDNSAQARFSLGSQGATPIAGGTLRVSNSAALGASQFFFNNGTLEAAQPLTLANGLSIGGRPSGPSRLAGAPLTFQGAIGTFSATGASGDISLVVDNDTTFTGAVAATGTPIRIGGGGTLRLNGDGSGLAAAVTLADSVTVALGNGVSLGSSAFTVGSAATLTGIGSVNNLVVSGGGTLSPGASPGTIAATTATFGPGGNYNFQIANAIGTPGFDWDLLDVSGTLRVASTAAEPFSVNLWSLSSISPDVGGNVPNFNNQSTVAWTFARAAGGLVDFSADKFTVNTGAVNGTGGFTNNLAGGSFGVEAAGGDLNVVFTPFVPGAQLAWYGNGVAPGGSGTWSSLGTTWSPNGGATIGTWDPTRKAVFGGPGGAVTIQGSGINAAAGLEFATDGYSLAGGRLTLTGSSTAANTVTVGSGATATIASVLAGSGGVNKAGPGTLVLSGSNTYTGGTTVAAGTLQVATGASLRGDVVLQTGSRLAFDTPSGTTSANAISGSGTVVKRGTGDLRLSGANNYAGGTRLEGGSITAGGATALGSAAVTAIDGALYAEAGGTISNPIVVGQAGGGPSTLLAGWDFQTTTTGGTAVLASPNTPTAFTANFGAGTLSLDGLNGSSAWAANQLNAFSGTAVNAGAGFATTTSGAASLAVLGDTANAKSAVFAVDMTGYSLLDVSYATQRTTSGFSTQRWAISTDGVSWTPISTIDTIAGSFEARQLPTISGLAGASTALLRVTFDGASTSTGNNRLDNIQLLASAGAAGGSVVLGTQATSGAAAFTGDVSLNQAVTLSAPAGGRASFSGVIANGVGQHPVTVTGGGTVVLTGANTYTGGTTVAAGTLIVNGINGPSGITVDGATLGGTGTVGPLTLGSGSRLSPGDAGPGILTAASAALGGGGRSIFQLADATGSAGSSWDLLDLSGGLTVSATQSAPYTIDLWTVSSGSTSGQAANFDPLQPYRWTFLETDATLGGIDLAAFAVNPTATGGTGGFANETLGGTFSVALSASGTGLDVVFRPNAAATGLIWYGDDATAGGKGTWATLNVNWFNGSALQTWDAGRRAVFGTSGGEVTIGPAGISAANGISFEVDGYVVGGGSLTLGGVSQTVNEVDVVAGATATVTAAVAGTAGLTKNGGGTLVLSGSNSFSGGTVVAAGGLQIGSGGTSGTLPGDVSLAAGTTLTVNRSDAVSLAGAVGGAGGLVKRGAGGLTLTGANTYLGGTTVEGGSVIVGAGGTSGGIAPGGGLTLAAATVLAFDRSDDVAFTGAVAGPGSLEQRGSGVLTLSRPTAYGPEFSLRVANGTVNLDREGATLVGILGAGNSAVLTGGTLQLTSNAGSETRFVDAVIDVRANSTLAINRTGTAANHTTADFAAPLVIGNDARLTIDYRGAITSGFKGTTSFTAPVTLASPATFAVTNSAGGTGEVILAGAVGDGGAGHGLSMTGSQRLTLAGANTYSGPTTVSAGVLGLGADGTIESSPTVNVASGGSFDVLAKTGGYVVPAAQTVTGGGSVVGGLVLGGGGTVSPGTGVGTLAATATVTLGGGGNYNWQVLDAQGTAGLGGWDLFSIGGGLTVTATAADPFAINLWSLAAGDPVTGGPAANFNASQAGAWRIASAAGGITGFTAEAFTVVTAAANGTSGFANPIAGGSFSVAQSGNDLNLVFTPGTPQVSLAWYGNGSSAGGNGTWSTGGATWWNGATTTAWNPAATASFGKPSGKVTIAAGGVSAAAGLAFGGDGYAVEGGTLTLSGSSAAANTIEVADLVTTTISAPLAGTAGFVKTGAGSLVLSGTNTLSGPATVAAGTLEVASAGGLAAAPVTVNPGATLAVAAGTTIRSPSVTVAGGTLSAGSLTIDATSGIAALAINAGTLAGSPATTVSGGGVLSLPQNARVTAAVGSLDIAEGSGGGKLDLGAGQLTVAPGGITAAAIRADLLAGRNGGAWNGSTGIVSSTAAASGGTRSVGYVVAGTGAVTVSFAAAGDTNLNGQVDVFDLVAVNSGGKYGSGAAAVWSQGDFNYDGVTNVFDLVSVNGAGAYGRGNYFPAAPTAVGGLGSPTAVPEPAALLVSGLLGLAALGRRRFACRRLRRYTETT